MSKVWPSAPPFLLFSGDFVFCGWFFAPDLEGIGVLSKLHLLCWFSFDWFVSSFPVLVVAECFSGEGGVWVPIWRLVCFGGEMVVSFEWWGGGGWSCRGGGGGTLCSVLHGIHGFWCGCVLLLAD
ncbi:hypothetical protein QL285_026981 [Trifolium repens]|nr:hypothetical protein QL285_026981 [Trifolium repens]